MDSVLNRIDDFSYLFSHNSESLYDYIKNLEDSNFKMLSVELNLNVDLNESSTIINKDKEILKLYLKIEE